MSVEPLVVEPVPFIIRVWPDAISTFQRLSSLERDWLSVHLPRCGDQSLTWSRSDSTESPHDLWVLHRWNEDSRTMDIDDMGYFPDVAAPDQRAAQPDEDRWDTDGGGNPLVAADSCRGRCTVVDGVEVSVARQ